MKGSGVFSKTLGARWKCFGWVDGLKRPLTGIAGPSGNEAVELGLRTESLSSLCSQLAASCPGSGEVLDSESPAQQEVGALSAGFAPAKSAKVKQQQSGFKTTRETSAANSLFILSAYCGLKTGGINPPDYFQGKWRRTGNAYQAPGKIPETDDTPRCNSRKSGHLFLSRSPINVIFRSLFFIRGPSIVVRVVTCLVIRINQ